MAGSADFLKDQSLSAYISLTYVGKNLLGLQVHQESFYSDLTISKTIWNKKGAISLVASDLFNTQDFKTSSNFLNQNNTRFVDQDNRYVKLGFSYKFGNSTLETNEKDKSNKERNRIQARD